MAEGLPPFGFGASEEEKAQLRRATSAGAAQETDERVLAGFRIVDDDADGPLVIAEAAEAVRWRVIGRAVEKARPPSLIAEPADQLHGEAGLAEAARTMDQPDGACLFIAAPVEECLQVRFAGRMEGNHGVIRTQQPARLAGIAGHQPAAVRQQKAGLELEQGRGGFFGQGGDGVAHGEQGAQCLGQ